MMARLRPQGALGALGAPDAQPRLTTRAAGPLRALVTILVLVLCLVPQMALAKGNFYVEDQVGLLTAEQREQLQASHAQLTDYIDTAFVTTDEQSSDVEVFADAYVQGRFGSDPAVIFVIDMYNRQVCVYANRAGREIVSDADARAITDNVYRHATRGDYYACADAALSQILTRCTGGRVPSPMKHVTNLLMALVLGILINFLFVYGSRARTMRRRATSQGMRSMAKLPGVAIADLRVTNRVRHYRSRSRGGGSGGGGGRGGGGGGGGGASHRF